MIDTAPTIMIEESFTEPDELKRSSFTLLACVLILLALGTVMVWSASAVEAAEGGRGGLSFWTPLFSHLKKVAVGLVLMFVAARLDLRRILRMSWSFYVAALLLLALVLVPKIGLEVNGSKRWMATGSLLGFALQPSELAKLALIVFLSAYIARTPDVGASFRRSFLPAAAAILVPGALILLETDFGTFVLVATLGFLLLLLAGARVRHLVLLAILGGGPALGFLWANPKTQYIFDRMGAFFDHHVRDVPQNQAQLQQIDFAESALHVGGVSGVGLGAGRHKLFFLKESENDFILSVVGEELGFVGTTVVVFLFALLLWSGRRVLLGVRHRFGFFVTAGVLITIAMQALMNVFVAVRWAPVKGIPLPFVSSGGSSLAVLCLGVGLILSVARQGHLSEQELAEWHHDEPELRVDGVQEGGEGMKRNESRRRGLWLAFQLGDLERYGVLALAACLVLGVAYLVQTVNGVRPAFERVGFTGDRAADGPDDATGTTLETRETRAETPPDPSVPEPRATETRRADAPGGGEFTVNTPAPARARRVGPRRADFDFFEPPVRVAGRPAPLAPPPPGATDEARIVVVQKGETLQRIAARELGDASRWRVLVEWNPGLDPKRLKRGQELRLPPPPRAAPAHAAPPPRLHEVAPDDTLQSLAERYYGDRARWIDLLEANRDQLRGPADLKVGSKIRIP